MADQTRRPDDAEDADEAAPENAGTADAALAIAARHALHDEELVVAFATDSLEDDGEVERARSFVDRCTACRELHTDIAAIGTAVRMDARGTMAAPRDFRLTAEDARRLGGRVAAGGFLEAFRRSTRSFVPQLGASMAALGVVGLLVGSVALSGGAALAPTSAGTGSAFATLVPEHIDAGAEQTGPKASQRSGAFGPLATDLGREPETSAAVDSAALDSNPVVWLLGGSLVLLIAGLVLIVTAFRRGRTGGSRTRDS